MRTLAGLGCGAVLIVAMAASDRAALIGNYGLVRCCPAGLAPSRRHNALHAGAQFASVLQPLAINIDAATLAYAALWV